MFTKEVFDNLYDICNTYEGACVAGGYLRDNFFGKPYKDIDIYIPNIKNKKGLLALPKVADFFKIGDPAAKVYINVGEHANDYQMQFITKVENVENSDRQLIYVNSDLFCTQTNLKKPLQTVDYTGNLLKATCNQRNYQTKAIYTTGLLGTFDCSLCQISFSLEGGLYMHPAFILSMQEKINIIYQRKQAPLKPHTQRILDKYPEFKPVYLDDLANYFLQKDIWEE